MNTDSSPSGPRDLSAVERGTDDILEDLRHNPIIPVRMFGLAGLKKLHGRGSRKLWHAQLSCQIENNGQIFVHRRNMAASSDELADELEDRNI